MEKYKSIDEMIGFMLRHCSFNDLEIIKKSLYKLHPKPIGQYWTKQSILKCIREIKKEDKKIYG